MRKLLYVCSILLVLGCSKEDVIVPNLQLDNIFEIKENSTDPIDKRIYAIYAKYKVPVFFNDTIGQVYVMDDVRGNPIYQTEKIDLGWTFYGYSKENYVFEYMKKEDQKSKALDIIEAYLADASPSLRPFSFFVTQSGQKKLEDKIVTNYRQGSILVGFRSVYLTGDWTAQQLKEHPATLKRQLVMDKIVNYVDDLNKFSTISKPGWYGGHDWYIIEPTVSKGWTDANALYDDWTGAKWYTAAELEAMRINARSIIGKFGFVKGNNLSKGFQTPQNLTNDLQNYVAEILNYDDAEFRALWGKYPLVMIKYEILRNVIENKMKVAR